MNKAKIKQAVDVTLVIMDFLLTFLSFMAIILFLVGGLTGIDEVNQHRQYVRDMQEAGKVTTATVDFQSPDNDWIFVDFTNAEGNKHSTRLEMKYYPESYWDELTPETTVPIRYLSYQYRNSENVVLEKEFSRVQEYRPFFDQQIAIVFFVSWAIIIIKPHPLYIGLVGKEPLSPLFGLGETDAH